MMVLTYMKGDSFLPSYYLPPSILVEGWEDTDSFKRRGRYYIPKVKHIVRKGDFEGMNILLERVTQGRLKKGSDIFAGHYEIISSKRRPIFSDIDLKIPERVIFPPDYVYLFVPNKQIAFMVMYSKYNRTPKKWIELSTPEHVLKRFINPLEEIFPTFKNKWRKIMNEFSKHKFIEEYRYFMRNIDIYLESDVKHLFGILDEYLLYLIENRPVAEEEFDNSDEDPYELNFIREDDRLLAQLAGERLMDDLIDAYEDDAYSFEDEEDSDLYVALSDVEEDFEEMDNLDRISYFSAVQAERQ